MKKVIISSVAIALLLLSGCSDSPTPSSDTQNKNQDNQVKEVPAVKTETVSSDNASVIDENVNLSADSNEMNMSSLESDMATIYFDYDKFFIRADMEDKVSADAKIANGAASKFMIKLEGNCDEWGSDEYNFALGLKRADAVKKALVAEGVEASRITMVSYGESNPTCTDKSQECWAKNRRVDFKLLP